MAYFSVKPSLFNPDGILAQQADPTGTAPWLITADFAAWNDANQPIEYVFAGGSCWANIPDWNTSAIMSFVENWQ